MKYSEFKKEVEKLGYKVEAADSFIRIKDKFMIAEINKKHQYRFDTEWDMDIKEELFNLIVKLAETTPEDREEEKKYYVPMSNMFRNGEKIYLMKDRSNKNKVGIDWSEENYIKKIANRGSFHFTEKEIKEIDERYWPFAEEVK